MEINFREHLSDDLIADIIKDEFRKYVRAQLNTEDDLKRFLSNAAYEVVSKQCDEVLDVNVQDLLRESVIRVVKELTPYTVFQKPNAWSSEYNEMYSFLSKCLEEQKPVVKKIVEEAVPQATLDELREGVKEYIIEAVRDIYKGKE